MGIEVHLAIEKALLLLHHLLLLGLVQERGVLAEAVVANDDWLWLSVDLELEVERWGGSDDTAAGDAGNASVLVVGGGVERSGGGEAVHAVAWLWGELALALGGRGLHLGVLLHWGLEEGEGGGVDGRGWCAVLRPGGVVELGVVEWGGLGVEFGVVVVELIFGGDGGGGRGYGGFGAEEGLERGVGVGEVELGTVFGDGDWEDWLSGVAGWRRHFDV